MEERNSACLSSYSRGDRQLVELCLESAGFSGRCTRAPPPPGPDLREPLVRRQEVRSPCAWRRCLPSVSSHRGGRKEFSGAFFVREALSLPHERAYGVFDLSAWDSTQCHLREKDPLYTSRVHDPGIQSFLGRVKLLNSNNLLMLADKL